MVIFSVSAVRVAATDTHNHYDPYIGAGSYWAFSWTLSAGNGIYGSFSCDGYGIVFFICDAANYATFQSNSSQPPRTYYDHFKDQGSGNWTFIVPGSGTWYFVLSNTYGSILSKQCHIDVYQDVTPPTITVYGPRSGESISAFAISASAEDNRFSVASMSISVDGTTVQYVHGDSIYYDSNSGFFSRDWHTIDIYASDNVGNSGYLELSVYMNNPLLTQQAVEQLALILGLITAIVIVALAVVVIRNHVNWERNDRGRVPTDTVKKRCLQSIFKYES